jgi:hypothetical protein
MKEIQELACYSPFLWCTVIEAIVCMWFLFLILGPAALGGIFILLLATPIGAYLYVDSLTYAFGWSVFMCSIRFCDTLVEIFFK